MCGIFGCCVPELAPDELQASCYRAAKALEHRGPDDEGVWCDPIGIGLAHRRLSILDLSPLGAQPYTASNGFQHLVYNGEIYNFAEMKEELRIDAGRTFQSTGDTEVLSVAIEEWGVEKTLQRANGMFALGLWDARERTLTLARDRIGIKPLYYGWNDLGFFFGSELKPFFSFKDWKASLSDQALSLYFEHGYITAPYSIFNGIYKLLPASSVTFGYDDLCCRPESFSPFVDSNRSSPSYYWRCPSPSISNSADIESQRLGRSYQDAEEELCSLLRSSTVMRTIADVPVGAFLSGGIDSSVIVGLIAAEKGSLTKTFSIGFSEKEYNEAPFAKEIAEILGTDHQELYVSANEALSVVPHLSSVYDEPFADSSQIPTILVSRLARKEVTVSLSGDGGDELFLGYQRYPMAKKAWGVLGAVPSLLRPFVRSTIRSFSESFWDVLYQKSQPLLPSQYQKLPHVGHKLERLSHLLECQSIGDLYRYGNKHWMKSHHPSGYTGNQTVLEDLNLEKQFEHSEDYFTYLDIHTYLPDDILTKVDRASMSCSLEARVPLLDHRIVEFARRLPLHWRMYQGEQKRILRKTLERFVPKSVFERPKTGFGVPLPDWLRGPLREWGEELISVACLPEDGRLNRSTVIQAWEKHQTKRANVHYPLWDILMFQDWLKKWRSHIEL